MAHEVETMAFRGATPWHGLGVQLQDPLSCVEILGPAGLDWTVDLEPMRTQFGEVDSHRAVVRSSDHAHLGVVGRGWGLVQNRTLAEIGDAIVGGEKLAETAASLRDGKIVYFCLRVGEMQIQGDPSPVESYLVLTTSHDGSRGVRILFTPVRVVCANTLRAAVEGSKDWFQINHTSQVERRLQEAAEAMQASLSYFERFKQLGDALARMPYSDEQFEELAAIVVPAPAKARGLTLVEAPTADVSAFAQAIAAAARRPEAEDEVRESVVDRRRALVEAYQAGPGAMPGTAWGAFQGVTDYLDHGRSYRGGRKAGSPEEARMYDLTFGPSAALKGSALATILTQVGMAA